MNRDFRRERETRGWTRKGRENFLGESFASFRGLSRLHSGTNAWRRVPGSALILSVGRGILPRRTSLPRRSSHKPLVLRNVMEVRFGGTPKPTLRMSALPGLAARLSANLLRLRRIEQAAREVARSGNHAEGDQFLAGNAVMDEMPVKRFFDEVEAQAGELRLRVGAERPEMRMLGEKLQRRFYGAGVIEGQSFIPLAEIPAGLDTATSAGNSSV